MLYKKFPLIPKVNEMIMQKISSDISSKNKRKN